MIKGFISDIYQYEIGENDIVLVGNGIRIVIEKGGTRYEKMELAEFIKEAYNAKIVKENLIA